MPHPFRNAGRFQCAALTLKAIGAAERKGSGLRDYSTSQYTRLFLAGAKSTIPYTSWQTAHARVDGGLTFVKLHFVAVFELSSINCRCIELLLQQEKIFKRGASDKNSAPELDSGCIIHITYTQPDPRARV